MLSHAAILDGSADLALIPDDLRRDVWAAALLIVKRYGAESMLEAARRADQLQEDGDWQGAVAWHRILDCIERIQAQRPAEGETLH